MCVPEIKWKSETCMIHASLVFFVVFFYLRGAFIWKLLCETFVKAHIQCSLRTFQSYPISWDLQNQIREKGRFYQSYNHGESDSFLALKSSYHPWSTHTPKKTIKNINAMLISIAFFLSVSISKFISFNIVFIIMLIFLAFCCYLYLFHHFPSSN